jgi:hypothetical protein
MNEKPKHNTPVSKTSSEKSNQRNSKLEEAEDDLRLVEIIKSRSHEIGIPMNIDEL